VLCAHNFTKVIELNINMKTEIKMNCFNMKQMLIKSALKWDNVGFCDVFLLIEAQMLIKSFFEKALNLYFD